MFMFMWARSEACKIVSFRFCVSFFSTSKCNVFSISAVSDRAQWCRDEVKLADDEVYPHKSKIWGLPFPPTSGKISGLLLFPNRSFRSKAATSKALAWQKGQFWNVFKIWANWPSHQRHSSCQITSTQLLWRTPGSGVMKTGWCRKWFLLKLCAPSLSWRSSGFSSNELPTHFPQKVVWAWLKGHYPHTTSPCWPPPTHRLGPPTPS